jgi:hypothetical protein
VGVGGQDGFIALAKEIRRARIDQAERLERRRQRVAERRERLLARGDIAEGPVEKMACPSCLTTFGFGDNCPGCGSELVCAGLIEAARTPVRARPSLSAHPVLAALLAVFICGAAVFLSAATFSGWLTRTITTWLG